MSLSAEVAALRAEVNAIQHQASLLREAAALRAEIEAIRAEVTRLTSGGASSSSSSAPKSDNQRLVDETLARAKSNDATLSEINFNHFREGGLDFADRLFDALVGNTTVHTVELASCGISNEGVKRLADLLDQNRTLTALNLESNNVSAPGILSLCDVLRRNQTLVELRLANQVQQAGNPAEMALAEMFKVNTTLCRFTLHVQNGGARTVIDSSLTRNREEARLRARKAQ